MCHPQDLGCVRACIASQNPGRGSSWKYSMLKVLNWQNMEKNAKFWSSNKDISIEFELKLAKSWRKNRKKNFGQFFVTPAPPTPSPLLRPCNIICLKFFSSPPLIKGCTQALRTYSITNLLLCTKTF